MADLAPRKKLAPSTIVAIVGIVAASVLSGIIIWQTAATQTKLMAVSQQLQIENKIDKLTEAVNGMNITIATIGQKLEDHIRIGR
jgi:hypothetical protein